MFLLAIAFHFSSSIQLVQHMLILVVPHILLVRHPRFGIVAYRRINRFLQYLLEIKGEARRNWAKGGLTLKKNNSCMRSMPMFSTECIRDGRVISCDQPLWRY